MADHGHSHTTPPQAPRTTGPRKLVRRPDDGHIAGVCAGVAQYFNVDPIIVRIAAVVLLFTGPGFFVYLAAWIFVPAADGSMLVDQVPPIPEDKTTQIVGIALIVLAVSLMFGGWWSPAREWLWPAGLVAVGAWLLLRRKDDQPDQLPPPPPPAGPSSPWTMPTPTSVAPAPPTPAGATDAAAGSSDHGPDAPSIDGDGGGEADPATAAGDTLVDVADDVPTSVFAAETGGGGVPPWGPDPTTMEGPSMPPASPASKRRRRFIGPLVFGALLIWGGIAWLAGVEPEDTLAIGLCIIGVGFVVGAFVGGARVLFFPAVLVGGALLVTSVVDIPWGGGIGEIRWDVDRVSELDETYERAIGDATLDLRGLVVHDGTDLEIEVDLGIGELVVYLPADTTVEVSAEVGAGEADVLDRTDDGVGVNLHRTIRGETDRGTIELDAHVGLGHLQVVQAA